MYRTTSKILAAAAILACPALATAQDRPITNREIGAMDVAKTPVTDLNLSRTEIPALLIEAQQRPYSLQGLGKCPQLVAAVEELDAVLGPDFDLPQVERTRLSKGRIAQWAVGTFIPFRSLIREVSGANKQEREILAAIQVGLARRGFLKGVGAARGCKYPASPATESIVAQRAAALAKESEDEQAQRGKGDEPRIEPAAGVAESAPTAPAPRGSVQYKSEAVVQPTR